MTLRLRVLFGILASLLTLLGADVYAHTHQSHSPVPLGVRLQREVGNAYEVLYDPRTGGYVVEYKGVDGRTRRE